MQEVANEILRQLKLAQGPAIRTKPLCPQVGVNQNPPQLPRQLKWCNIEKKYMNHETHECFFRPRYENPNQGIGQEQPVNPQQQQRVLQAYPQQGYGSAMNEIPKPLLGQQTPMPRAIWSL